MTLWIEDSHPGFQTDGNESTPRQTDTKHAATLSDEVLEACFASGRVWASR